MKRSRRISLPLVQLGQGAYARGLHDSDFPAIRWKRVLWWSLLVLSFLSGLLLGVWL